jgi:hypothetical protein
MIPGIFQIQDGLIVNNQADSIDPRWSYRAWSNHANAVINIPKVASNTLGITLVANAWHETKTHACVNKTIHVVLRDPVERWQGCMAEHLSHRIEHGGSLSDIEKFIKSFRWMDPNYTDMHLYSQSAYCSGVSLYDTKFYLLEHGLSELFEDIDIPYTETVINHRAENKNNRSEINDIIMSIYDSGVDEYVTSLYRDDYTMLEIVGSI